MRGISQRKAGDFEITRYLRMDAIVWKTKFSRFSTNETQNLQKTFIKDYFSLTG